MRNVRNKMTDKDRLLDSLRIKDDTNGTQKFVCQTFIVLAKFMKDADPALIQEVAKALIEIHPEYEIIYN